MIAELSFEILGFLSIPRTERNSIALRAFFLARPALGPLVFRRPRPRSSVGGRVAWSGKSTIAAPHALMNSESSTAGTENTAREVM